MHIVIAALMVFSVESLQAPVVQAAMEPDEIMVRLATKQCVPSHPIYCKKRSIRYNRKHK